MNRWLFGILVVLIAVIGGYFYNERLAQRCAPAASAPAVEIAALDATPAQTPAPAQSVQPKDGRLLVTLANGLTVLIQEDNRFPLVSERLYVRAGSAYEKPAEAGISHLLEHMVFNKTRTRPKGGVASDIESVGGEINASTSFDYTVFMADLPAESWQLGLEVFQDMTFGAAFDPEELVQEKKVVIAELKKGQDEPERMLFQANQARLWAGKPYQFPVIGFEDTVNAATSDDLHAYVHRFYQPQSMLLVVVGDVKAVEVLENIQQVYGSLENDRTVLPPQDLGLKPTAGGPSIQAEAGKWNKCRLQLAFSVPGLHSAQDVPLEVLADLLGGGKTSRLYRKFFYEQHLVEDIDVGSITLERGGMLLVDATLSQDKLAAFWPALVAELAGLSAESFSDEELDRAKLNIEDGMFRARETLKGLATKLGYYQFFGLGPDGEANAIYAVRTVDRVQLKDLLGTYVQPANASLAMFLPGQEKAEADKTGQEMLAVLNAKWPATALSAPQAEETGKAGAPEIVDLGGGHRVVFLPDPTLPYASVALAYRGGDSLLSPREQGLSELTAKALTRSTEQRTAPQIEDFLANRAASIGAASGRDTFTLSARYPTRFEGEVLELFTEMVRQPAFAPQEFDRARQMQIAAIEQAEDKPTGLAFRNLFPFLLPGSHYGYFRAGQPLELAGFDSQQAKGLWEKQRAMPWVLSVCGVFDRKAVLALAASLADGPARSAPEFTAPAWGNERELQLTLKERNQTHLFWVFPVPGEQSPDTPALELLQTALSGQGGVLFRDLRDKQGLGYVVTCHLWQAPETGFMALYIGTYPDKADQAMAGFRNVVAELGGKGLPEEEIDGAKQALEGEYYMGHQSLASRSHDAAQNLVMGYALDRDREIVTQAQAVTPAEVIAVAKKYLDPSKAYLLKIVP